MNHKTATVASILLLAIHGTSQSTLHVPKDYSTIQKAIDAAKAKDQVVVAAGTYREAIDFKGKAIIVRSADGPLKTTIDATGQKDRSTVLFNKGETRASVLDGFTLLGGTGYLVSSGTEHAGGGIYIGGTTTSPTVQNNIIRDHDLRVSRSKGGAICVFYGGTPLIRRNLLIRNKATYGGALYITGSTCHPLLEHNTIAQNVGAASAGGGAIYVCTRGSVTVHNSILWGNGRTPITNRGCTTPITITVNYSDVEGGASGTGNLKVDPKFVNPAASDFHLQSGSPCIDTGDPNSRKDPDGTRADMGAFYRHRVPGSYTAFGSGCAGSRTPPRLFTTDTPRVGRPFSLTIANLKAFTGGVIVIGNSDKSWNGARLPLDLKIISMPGCVALVNWVSEIGFFTTAGGSHTWKGTLPADSNLIGNSFFNQVWVHDAQANSLGVATSNGGKGIFGS